MKKTLQLLMGTSLLLALSTQNSFSSGRFAAAEKEQLEKEKHKSLKKQNTKEVPAEVPAEVLEDVLEGIKDVVEKNASSQNTLNQGSGQKNLDEIAALLGMKPLQAPTSTNDVDNARKLDKLNKDYVRLKKRMQASVKPLEETGENQLTSVKSVKSLIDEKLTNFTAKKDDDNDKFTTLSKVKDLLDNGKGINLDILNQNNQTVATPLNTIIKLLLGKITQLEKRIDILTEDNKKLVVALPSNEDESLSDDEKSGSVSEEDKSEASK